MPPEKPTPARPLRIGFWCYSANALRPGSMLGSYVTNLIDAFLQAPEQHEVVVVLPVGEQERLEGEGRCYPDRLRILPAMKKEGVAEQEQLLTLTPSRLCKRNSEKRESALDLYLRWSQRGCAAKQAVQGHLRKQSETLLDQLGVVVRLLVGRARRGKRHAFVTILPVLLCLCLLFAALWTVEGLGRLAFAAFRGLTFPVRLLDRLAQCWQRRGEVDEEIPQEEEQPVPPPAPKPPDPGPAPFDLHGHALAAKCDLWIFPDSDLAEKVGAPVFLLLRELGDFRPYASWELPTSDCVINRFRPGQVEPTLYIVPSESLGDGRSLADLALPEEKARLIAPAGHATDRVSGRTWNDVARDWLTLADEALELSQWERKFDRWLIEPWPRLETCPASGRTPLELFLFLHIHYAAGVWEATKDLLHDLVAINRERGRLRLTLGLHETQTDTSAIDRLSHDLTVKWVRPNPINRAEVRQMFGHEPAWLANRPEQRFIYLSGAAATAMRADAWLALVDRFSLPLLPARPYGVVVYDMIQRAVPEGFEPSFFRDMKSGIAPSIRGSHLVLTTSPQTRDDVIAEYGLEPGKVLMVPLSCNPRRRFEGVQAQPVVLPREPFILCVTNWARHKGSQVLVRGYARLKKRLGKRTPLLVLCGWNTDFLAPGAETPYDIPNARETRQLVRDLGLKDKEDFAFLGFVTDSQLLNLYQRCTAVVNAAMYDNGSFSLPEAHYFGKPAVTSDYPAAQYLCERFAVPAQLFRARDDEACADALFAALQEGPRTPVEIAQARARFEDPEFSQRRYAERVYDGLVRLAEEARRQRSWDAVPAAA